MKRYLPILLASLVLASCSLKENVESSSTMEGYYKTAAQCKTGLNGCYIPLRNIYGSINYFAVTECQADMMYINQPSFADAILLVSPDKPQFASTMWTQGYIGVMRCNAMVAAIERSPLSDEEKAPLMAEAVILRAFFYYTLTANFGDVPFYEEEVTNKNNDSIARLPRYPAPKIRAQMTDEIQEWVVDKKALPLSRTYDANANPEFRVGASVALMLAGRMSLWDGRWNDAINYFSLLESIYGELGSYSLEDVKFRNKYTPESIFEIPYAKEDYKLQLFQSLASRCLPPRSLQSDETVDELDETDLEDYQADYYGGIGIPELGRLATTRGRIRPSSRIMNLLPYSGNDKRTCSSKASGEIEGGGGWMAWGWKGYHKEDDRSVVAPAWHWFLNSNGTDFGQNSTPYMGDKFWCFNMSYTYDDNNLKIFRYAGAVLGLAEAWLEMGDLDKAIDYLNIVRRRAATNEYPKNPYPDIIRQYIMDEYGMELFGEFERKHDLVRWDIWYDAVKSNTQARYLQENVRQCHRYYPIPAEQITYSKGALDNKEYNKYGL